MSFVLTYKVLISSLLILSISKGNYIVNTVKSDKDYEGQE